MINLSTTYQTMMDPLKVQNPVSEEDMEDVLYRMVKKMLSSRTLPRGLLKRDSKSVYQTDFARYGGLGR